MDVEQFEDDEHEPTARLQKLRKGSKTVAWRPLPHAALNEQDAVEHTKEATRNKVHLTYEARQEIDRLRYDVAECNR